jgi:hypothetical protein
MSQFNVKPEVKEAYLTQRLEQLNNEGWAHELNLATAEALPDGDQKTEAIAQAQNAIEVILNAILVVEAQLPAPVEISAKTEEPLGEV